jgi:hypothetical protein
MARPTRQEVKTQAPRMDPAKLDPARDQVAALAYQLWLERGSPIGSDQEDWYRAEAQLTIQRAA